MGGARGHPFVCVHLGFTFFDNDFSSSDTEAKPWGS
jgi:hypothetical protein